MYDKVDREGKQNICVRNLSKSLWSQKWIRAYRLTTSARQQIAAKLQQGISKEKFLDDIIESVRLEFQREHLVDKRDLFNIEKAFGLDNIQWPPNDQDNVLAWIQEWEGSDNSPIVFYKLQGQLKEELAIEKDDFVVIMQTEFQKHLMQKFGSKGLCCDTTMIIPLWF